MKAVVLAGLALAGCASGTTRKDPSGTVDAKVDDPTIDAPENVFVDAPSTLHDAPDVDSAPHPVDAPPMVFMDAAACIPQTTELLANPTFDLDASGTGWTQVPVPNAIGGPYYPITNFGPAPHSAPYHALLGGLAGEDCNPPAANITDQVYQNVVIPPGTTQLVLTGVYSIGTMEPNLNGQVYDRGELALIQTSGAPIEVAVSGTNLTSVANWTPFSKTFANPAGLSGTTVRVRATSTGDDSYNSNFFFDTLSLKATHCP